MRAWLVRLLGGVPGEDYAAKRLEAWRANVTIAIARRQLEKGDHLRARWFLDRHVDQRQDAR